MYRSIFSASFEESKKVVSKDILTRDGAGIGDSSSMKLRDRIVLFLLGSFFFGILFYGIGIGMPNIIGDSKPDEVFLISYSSVNIIEKVGSITKPFILVSLFIFLLALTINLLPKKNYTNQLMVGVFILTGMILCGITSLLPFTIGLTVDGLGWFGLAFQIIVCVGLIFYLIHDRKHFFQKQLWGEFTETKNWNKVISKSLKKYSGILLLLIVINRWFLHIGEGGIGSPSFLGLLYGWALLIVVVFLSFAFNLVSPQFLSIFYFVKYGEQYREYFEILDEQWYGKRKAKRLGKRRKKNLE